MPGVTDDQRIEVLPGTPEEARLGERQPCRRSRACAPLVGVSLPDGDVALADLDAGAAKRRDHLRVSRVVALVRAEVEDAHFARMGLDSMRGPNGFARALEAHTQPPPHDEPNPNLRTRGTRGRDESAPPAVAVSGQDLVDVEFRLLTADCGFLVLAREHLADQAE